MFGLHNGLWHVVADMAKSRQPAPAPVPENDALVQAVDRLTAELAALRQVIDEIREDFSWLTRNGLPVQPIEHVHVKRMALDPCAEDWGERLEIERSTYYPRGSASPLESNALDQIADELKATFEAVAQGQLEFVLTALDEVRTAVLAALKHRQGDPVATPLSNSSPVSATSEPVASIPTTAPSSSASIPPKPPPGQLF